MNLLKTKRLRQAISNAVSVAGKVITREGAKIADRVQHKLGEDYDSILKENPLVRDTLSRSSLLEDNRELLSTAFNIPWSTTLLWSAAAGSTSFLPSFWREGRGFLVGTSRTELEV